MKRVLALTLCILLAGSALSARPREWRFEKQFNFGCNVLLAFGKGQKLPGLRAYAGFSVAASNASVLLNYGPSLSIYTRSIGTNLNPLVADWQLDFTNAVSAGAAWGREVNYVKFSRTLHNGDYYNLALKREGCALLGLNYILNNHRRHQVVGALNLNVGNFSLNYYNDGGSGLGSLGLGDSFDRYWTGGLGIIIHNRHGYNTVESGFDQFTGYIPLLYELSTLLGVNVPLYDSKDPDTGKYNYNTSQYYVRFNFDRYAGVNAGVLGSLQKNGKYYGMQDIIHLLEGFASHPNYAANRFFIGGTFNSLYHAPRP